MKKIISLMLMIALCLSVTDVPVEAKWDVKELYSGEHYRIRYAGNGSYLDIPADGYTANGTQLQVWEYAEGNQNQIFKLVDTGNGWHILSREGKVIEVRDSRHDDGAPVSQWDSHDLACGLWDIQKNSDGSYSFRNRESGKYLNVYGGGNASNGTKIIQWYNDGTEAMRFYLEVLRYEDVKSASYKRPKFRKTEIVYLKHDKNDPSTKDWLNWDTTGLVYEDDNYVYTPLPGEKVFVSMEFLAPDVVARTLVDGCYRPSFLDSIKEIASKNAVDQCNSIVLGTAAKALGLTGKAADYAIPGMELVFDISKAMFEIDENDDWNRYVDAAYPEGNAIQGVIIYHYYKIKLYDNLPVPGTSLVSPSIVKTDYIEYKSWNGDNFNDVWHPPVDTGGCNGTWTLQFK